MSVELPSQLPGLLCSLSFLKNWFFSVFEFSIKIEKSIIGITNAREAMKKLPEEDRAKIREQVEVFRIEKRAFDNEVSTITLK